ncbi:MAG: hypothetical protein AAF657_07035 [Acidobacteriota bacterium]
MRDTSCSLTSPSADCCLHRRHLTLAILLCGLLGLAPPSSASDVTISGFVAVRGAGVQSQPSWREGGFGRLTLGSDAADDEGSYALGKLHVGIDWQPSPFFGAYVHVAGRAEPGRVEGREVGVIEAYLHASVSAGQTGSVNFQLGHFILPTSRENTEFVWASPYTLTFSALNTWIGEETRLTGLLTEYEVATGDQSRVRFGGSAFGGNDSNGALLAWRGWSMGDRLTAFGEVVPLPPIGSLQPDGAFAAQRDDGSKPYGDDLDDRIGWSGFLRWQRDERAVIQYTHYDNRGDRELHQGEYAWRTKFDLLGIELRPHDNFVLIGEALDGSTGMGDPLTTNVQADIETAYLLASWNPGRFRASLRYDTFETVDVDGSGADNNNEDGEAWTFALFFEPRDALRLGLEYSSLEADRPAAAEVGFDPNTDGETLKLELRYYFDW